MGFWESVRVCFKKYFTFRGRAQRSEYWWFYLFTTLVGIALFAVDALVHPLYAGVENAGYWESVTLALGGDFTPFSDLFSLLTFIPIISAGSRRLHDINKSGWWQALFLVPAFIMGIGIGFSIGADFTPLVGGLLLIGGIGLLATVILIIVWFATDSDKADNRYGPSPKYGGQAMAFD